MVYWSRKEIIISVIAVATVVSLAAAVLPVTAIETGLNATAQASGLNTSGSLPLIIARIIQQLLIAVGVVLVCLLFYAGFKWMIARDSAEEVKDAQTTIRNAVIGLVIVLASYSIASYVIEAAIVGTGGTPTPLKPGQSPTGVWYHFNEYGQNVAEPSY